MSRFKVITFNELDSTNKYIKENLDKLRDFDVVAADKQLSGYGRMKRDWFDDSDNLSFSILFTVNLSERTGLITQLAAASVQRVLESFGVSAEIKWPNDVVVNMKKISGILVETIITGDTARVVLGIGLNINNTTFSSNISSIATSMKLETNNVFSKDRVLEKLLEVLEVNLNQFFIGTDEFLEICRNKSTIIGESVYLSKNRLVEVIDIDYLGRLEVIENGKRLAFIGSEVSLNNLYNK